MQYNLTGKHLDISDALKAYVSEKMERIDERDGEITSAQITLGTDRHLKTAEATLHVRSGQTLHADAEHSDMYHAVDLLVEKLSKQASGAPSLPNLSNQESSNAASNR